MPDGWYIRYGPGGEDKVVRIDDMAVAKWTNNEGTDNFGLKAWQDAIDWANVMNWLSRDEWRMSTEEELVAICGSKYDMGGYASARYWSATEDDTYNSVNVYFDGRPCQSNYSGKSDTCFLQGYRVTVWQPHYRGRFWRRTMTQECCWTSDFSGSWGNVPMRKWQEPCAPY